MCGYFVYSWIAVFATSFRLHYLRAAHGVRPKPWKAGENGGKGTVFSARCSRQLQCAPCFARAAFREAVDDGITRGARAPAALGGDARALGAHAAFEAVGDGDKCHDNYVIDDGHHNERLEGAVGDGLHALSSAHHVHEANGCHQR